MVGLGGSVGRARALAVGLNCYLVIFCMYVFRGFHPTLGGLMVPALIIGPMVSSPCIGRNVRMGFYSYARYKFVLCALCVMIGLRVFSYFYLVLGGAVLPVAVDGRPWFLPCLWGVVWLGSVVYWFCIVYFGVDFIWGDGGSVASSLLVWAILLLFVTNFTQYIVTSSLLFFLFNVILLVVVMILMLYFSQYW